MIVRRNLLSVALLAVLAILQTGIAGAASRLYPSSPITISGTPPTQVAAGSAYRFVPTTAGGASTRRYFFVRNRPAWASFNARTGELAGTPNSSQVGSYENIRISVTDGRTSGSLPAFGISVTGPTGSANRPPVLAGSPPATIAAGSLYSFQPAASDPDGDALTFTIQGKPAWANFAPTTGRLTGTPAAAQVGTYSGITIIASDGKSATSLRPFTIEVLPGTATTNTAPSISGTPATSVNVGGVYSFQPAANDADGDVIAFGIANKPAWATFSIQTGQLAGQPAAADVGTYSNIVIAVSDSKANTTLPAFSITVAPGITGSALLTWAAPTVNTDGSPLTDLAGFRIAYGLSAGALNKSITVSSPTTTSFVVDNLSSGTWYFAITAYNTAGATSVNSTTASKTIQ